jgi:two-component sensor histidine kinase
MEKFSPLTEKRHRQRCERVSYLRSHTAVSNRGNLSLQNEGEGRGTLAHAVQRRVRRSQDRPFWLKIFVGVVAAGLAVLVRWTLPLNSQQLPTVTVVIATTVVTTFVGVRAGILTAALGGLACWYLFSNNQSLSLADGAWVPLAGFSVIAISLVGTAALYRESERRSQAKELAAIEERVEHSNLFAREMAHRLKNTLAIVQSVAFQTFGNGTAEATLFASRLKALADANELLSERVEEPEAEVLRVVKAALQPFHLRSSAMQIDCVDAIIPSRQVLSLALALHELATNATKYGALSVPTGRILLRLESQAQLLQVTWQEQGGPLVTPPEREGFGSRLLRRTGSNATLTFAPEGLQCSFVVRTA